MSDSLKTGSPTRRQLNWRLSQLQALHRIGMAMASTMNSTEIVQLVVTEVMELTGATTATFYQVDEQAQMLVPELTIGKGFEPLPLDLSESEDLTVQVAHTGELAQSRPAPGKRVQGEKANRRQASRPRSHEGGADEPVPALPPVMALCRLALPLVAGDEVLGVIDLRSTRCQRFDTDMEDLLGTLASQAAQVLRNARTHEELEQHYRELSLLYEIQQEIDSTFDYQSVLNLIVNRVQRLMDARECTIRLLTTKKGKRTIRIAATTGRQFIGSEEVPFEESHVDHEVLAGEMIYMEDVRTDHRFRWREEAIRAGVVSMLCAPLIAHRRIIGTIRVYTAERQEFSVAERKMLLAVAGQAATAIENARLYKQLRAKNRELTASYEALRQTQKELVEKARLAALGEMAATVAHEIRNPLTSVRGYAQRISRRCLNEGECRLREYTDIIIEEVDRLNKFIQDVLDFARRAKPTFEKTNVNDILSAVINLTAEPMASRDIVLIADLDMNLRDTVLDKSLIRRLFMNILQNARQALDCGGIITVKTQNAGKWIRIRIVDNGPGIARDVLAKIWTPFFTTKTHGTGLGLSLVQRIVEDHRGRVYCRSRAGVGTIFDIFLPVVKSEEELSDVPVGSVTAPAKN